jgi:hypothetical protein
MHQGVHREHLPAVELAYADLVGCEQPPRTAWPRRPPKIAPSASWIGGVDAVEGVFGRGRAPAVFRTASEWRADDIMVRLRQSVAQARG